MMTPYTLTASGKVGERPLRIVVATVDEAPVEACVSLDRYRWCTRNGEALKPPTTSSPLVTWRGEKPDEFSLRRLKRYGTVGGNGL